MTIIQPAAGPLAPREHQKKAIKAATSGLTTADRGQVIMACGTGKTLVGIRAAEALVPDSDDALILLLFPTIGLLDQTVRAWQTNTLRPLAALAVCSDEKVGRDDSTVHVDDVPITVTTDPAAVAAWAGSTTGTRVVFATYQSSQVVADAHALGLPEWGLIVADEAHRMAGPNNSLFATALDNALIPARRRLFLTATPRIKAESRTRKGSETEARPVVSMDDEDLFGPVLHRLPFAEAISLGLLSDYRIAVVGVTDAQVHRFVEENPELDAGRGFDAKMIATQIATGIAVRQYGLSGIIGFHNTIQRSKTFASTIPHTLDLADDSRLPVGPVTSWHVDGGSARDDRQAALRSLGTAHAHDPDDGWVLVNNVRCLTEGIDVPTLDGVLIADPRKSVVEVAQGVGRAIRLHPTRSDPAVILLPVYLVAGENPEAVIECSEFKHVYQTILAMQAHDDRLVSAFRAARQNLGEGGSGGEGEPPIKAHVDFLIPGADDVLAALTVQLVQSTTSTWDEGIGALRAFVADHGHARVIRGRDVTEGGFDLGNWVSALRHKRKSGMLSAEQVAELEALGMIWDVYEAWWQEGIAALRAFVAERGHARVPATHVTDDGFNLGTWINTRRQEHKSGKLSAEQVAELEALGMIWDPGEANWQEGIAALRAFVAEHGHALVPRQFVTDDGFNLGTWVGTRRQVHKSGRLSAERTAELEALGMIWDPGEANWQEGIAALRAFVAEHGHARVPHKYVTDEGFAFWRWINNRRQDRKAGRLPAERIAELEALGMIWDVYEANWQEGIAALRAFVAEHGHARVHKYHVTDDGFTLGDWVSNRRTNRRDGVLSADRVAELEALGMIWNTREAAWEEGIAALRAYVAEQGHARVPHRFVTDDGFNLGTWIGARRQDCKVGKLPAEKVAELEALGMIWEARR